jgi:hypothetical protein
MRKGMTGRSWNAEKNVPNWKSQSATNRGVKRDGRDTRVRMVLRSRWIEDGGACAGMRIVGCTGLRIEGRIGE